MRSKLILTTGIVILTLLSLYSIASAGSFDDVPRSHWAYDAVEYLADKGFVEGYPDGTFQGDNLMTRYELAMLVARAYAKMETMMGRGADITIDVEALMDDLMDEFSSELDEIRSLVKKNQVSIRDLQRQLEENSAKDAELAEKLAKLGSKFKFNGMFKLRLDAMYYNPGNRERHRPRISFRFDMKAPVNNEIMFGGRLGTGGVGTNVASEQTLTNEFGIKAFDIERAYLQWNPDQAPSWTFGGGKFKPNWATTSNFIDSDLNVEGLAQRYEHCNWVLNFAEIVPTDKGGYLVGQVGYMDLLIQELDLYLTYHFLSSGAFETMWIEFPYWFRLDADEYSALEAYAKYMFYWNEDWPVYLQAAYRMNLADELAGMPSGLQEAAMAQVTFGKIKDVHDYDFWVNYGRVLPNSIIPQFAHSTIGVDHESWSVGINYQAMPHVLLKLTYINAQNLTSNPNNSWDYFVADIITDF